MSSLTASKTKGLGGNATPPGDKSISHRALILGGMASGTTTITGLLEGSDVLATAGALRQLGIDIEADRGVWRVHGAGAGGFAAPKSPLDLGNSGTGARLLMGAVAGCGISAVFTGDESLSNRPMARITTPLEAMGAHCTARDGKYLPLTIDGTATPRAIEYKSPHASAQIKSAILLAGLTARGATTVIEPAQSRDHTEAMLRHLGAEVTYEKTADGHAVTLKGEAALTAADIKIPGDPSAAAFIAVATLITGGLTAGEVTINNVGINPLRLGLFETLIEMGGDIEFTGRRRDGGEEVADIIVRHAPLKGVTVPAARAASMIDEYPILAVAAACAEGVTTMEGIGELRVKETDRIRVMEENLIAAGVNVTSTEDSMTVTGAKKIQGGIKVDACHDHRIAMSFLVLGLAAENPVTVTGTDTIATSFPGFAETMNSLGAALGGSTKKAGA